MGTASLTHDERYSLLDTVREEWCRRNDCPTSDRSEVTIQLDGRDCIDIPGFYLALGRAVNGPGGYYGGCLDALSDCLSGGFGLSPPFTLIIRNADAARAALGHSALIAWRSAWQSRVLADPTLSDSDRADLGIPLGDLPADQPPYFDSILEVLSEHGVHVVLDSTGS